MRAIGLSTYGGPEVLDEFHLPAPEAGPGQVRVRVAAAAVNPADVMLRDGSLAALYEGLATPYVPGMDLAGVIDQLGDGVDARLSVGDTVVGIVDNTGSHGAYSELVVLPADSVTAAPAGTTHPESASFLMNALTARNALDLLALPAGATVLVTGAAGAVGSYAIPLAKAAGLRVIALASLSDAEQLADWGADTVVPRGDDAVARVRDAVPGGVDAVIDGACLYDGIVGAIRDGGALLDLRFWDAEPGRDIRVVHANVRQRAQDATAIAELRDQVEQGLLPLRVAATYPASEAVAAHRLLDQGGLRGRIVLTFDD